MLKQAKTNASRFLAVFLTLLLIWGMIPVGVVPAFAAENNTATVQLPDGVSAQITLTDEQDAKKVYTAQTDESFAATVEGVDDAATYTLMVSQMEQYKDYTLANVTVGTNQPIKIAADVLQEKDTRTFAFAETGLSKMFGDSSFFLTFTEETALEGITVSYTSSEEKVATVSAQGEVTILGAGTTTITATAQADGEYREAKDTVILTVGQLENALSFNITEVNWTYGDVKKVNELTVQPGAAGTLSYSSDNSEVAVVNEITGDVDIVKPGVANITATFTAGEYSGYKDSAASYKINASKKSDAIKFQDAEIQVTYGDESAVNDTLTPKDINGEITYSSNNEKVATVNAKTGQYTIVGAGEAVITATLTGNDYYEEATATYKLIVAQKANVISFESGEKNYTYGDPAAANALSTGGFTGPVSYKSSNPDVAEVAADGTVTLKKPGSATITASMDGDANYKAASAAYDVNVEKKSISFTISATIQFGQDDPDLTDMIREEVKKGLIESEQNNEEILNRVVGLISYKFEDLNPDLGENRRVKDNYSISFETQKDDYYSFDKLGGTLSVANSFTAREGFDYTITGLNDGAWGRGSVDNGVSITVKDSKKYAISNTDTKKTEGWSGSLTFNEAQDQTNHTFYIKNLETGEISRPVTKTFGIDGAAPAIENFKITDGNWLDKIIKTLFGTFWNDQVRVTVTVTDAGPSSGIETITLYADGVEFETVQATDGKGKFVIPVDKIDGEVKAFDKILSAKATDKVGNETENAVSPNEDNSNIKDSRLMIETVKPIVSEEITASVISGAENADATIYSGDIKFSLTAQDVDSGLSSVDITINGKGYTDKNITEYPIIYTKKETTEAVTTKQTYEFSTEGITPNEGGEYIIEVNVIDNAGNVTLRSLTVQKDQTSPVISSFDFSKNAEDATEEEYGYYFKEDTAVTITAEDPCSENEVASGVDTITVILRDKDGKYYSVDAEKNIVPIDASEIKGATKHEVDEKSTYTFTIKAPFKGQIYAMATDKVDNNPLNSTFAFTQKNETEEAEAVKDIVQSGDLRGYKFPRAAILETKEEHDSENHIVFSKEDAVYKTTDGGELYTGTVPVKIVVTDTYSGIRSIEWSIEVPGSEASTQSGTVIVKNNKTLDDGSDSGWTWNEVDTEKNLIKVMEKTIQVTENSNNIVVHVVMTDRAGNISENSVTFSVDNTAPTVTVTYDDDKSPADNGFPTFYKAPRTATITVTERNFDPNAVQLDIKSVHSDKNIPDTSSLKWTAHRVNETYRTDEDTYTATITFEADDDYTLAVASCKDLAGRECASFTYEGKSDPTLFTIDKTAPTVTVSYDNNASMNGNYFKADRIATITVTEHNFDAGRVTVNGNATDNGASAAFPGLVWTSDNGDIHTATIRYAADAHYTFSIDITDKAGNTISNQAQAEFYVDKTAPTLEITGVADRSANNGTVAPIINFMDTNFDADAVTYTLTGVNNGTVTYPASKANVANGQTVTFADFERVQNVDDIYTLTATITDKAGNETTKTITFSANRFGSVYDLDGLKNMLGKYLRNEEDVVFTEVNVDSLNKSETKLKITKNGTPRDLVEGVDYTVLETGGSGLWSRYRYTINKALFTDDGRYSISVYTVDAAGNINENIDETKKAEISFGVDKTNPVIVPIDFESGVQYPVEVKTVSLEIKDNLVLDSVKIYLNDVEVQYENSGETYTFDIPEKNEKQNVRIVAVDAAGNAYELPVENFLVSTNVFARWFNNTPLFVGSLVGVALIAGAIVFLVGSKRTKKEAAAK